MIAKTPPRPIRAPWTRLAIITGVALCGTACDRDHLDRPAIIPTTSVAQHQREGPAEKTGMTVDRILHEAGRAPRKNSGAAPEEH